MKSFQQNLLVALALGLCALCAYQWYAQTRQRNQVDSLNRLVYGKALAIRDYTNSISALNHQVAQMDARITELKETLKTNRARVDLQAREIDTLKMNGEALTNTVSQYKEAVAALESKLKDAYDGIKKQNDALKELVSQRDEFVRKYNDSIKERNDLVAKYNDLVDQVKQAQSNGQKP
jgi:predicted  nucleic acid-binding Zn-ribbon protein